MMASPDQSDLGGRASHSQRRYAAPHLEPLTIPHIPDAIVRSPNRDTALSLSLPLDYYFASPRSGGPVSSSMSGSNSASFSGASDYSQSGGVSRSNTQDLSPTYGIGGAVEEEIRALEKHLQAQQLGDGNLRRQQETWLNDDEPLVIPPISFPRGDGPTDSHMKQPDSINNSLSSSPASEYSSHFSSAIPSSDMHSVEPHELSDAGFTPGHARRPSQSHQAVNHRRIHVLDVSSSESSLDLSLHADSLRETNLKSSSKEGSQHPTNSIDVCDSDKDITGRQAVASSNRESAGSSVGSGITARLPSSSVSTEPDLFGTLAGPTKRSKVPGNGTHTRLAFVAPSDLSSRSLEDLKRQLSATDAESGRSQSAGGLNPQGSKPHDGNRSAPAYRTTFRLSQIPSDRGKHHSDLSAAEHEDFNSFKAVFQIDTPTIGNGVFQPQQTPGRSPSVAPITTPRQSDVEHMEVTPRGPGPGDKQVAGYRSTLSPTTTTRVILRDSVISESCEEGSPLVGLGFGDSVDRQGRGLSPDPPPRSSLRRSSTALDKVAGYPSSSDNDATSSHSTISLEGVPDTSCASFASSPGRGLSRTSSRSDSSHTGMPEPAPTTTIPPARGSSILASRAVAMSPSYASLANITPSDYSTSSLPSRPSGAAIPTQRESTFSPASENIHMSKTSSPGVHRLSLSSIRRPASLLSLRSSSNSVLRPSHKNSFSSAQARPWPAAMVLGHVKGMKNPGDRAREYAKATNSLLSTDSGMVEWYTFVKAKSQQPEHAGRARERSKMTAVNLLGVGPSPTGPHAREVSAQSLQSDASFPMRMDATMATEIDHREIDPLNPPDALPPLPYPQLQLVASSGMKASASSQSVKSLGSAFGGSLFAALGRRGSGKKERQDTSPRRIGFPISQPGAAPSSAMKRSLDLAQVRQTSVPPPTGPRSRQGASFGIVGRSSESSYNIRASLDGRLPTQSTSTSEGLRKQSAPALSHSPRSRDMRDEDLRHMQEVLPNANPNLLQHYLQGHGGQMEAIGAYLEDERANRLSLGHR